MDFERLCQIANLNCGDVLKAMLLNHLEPELKLNLLYLRAPEREAEKTFDKLQGKGVAPLTAFREDHSKPSFRFESVDPVQEARNRALAAARAAPSSPSLPYDSPPKKVEVKKPEPEMPEPEVVDTIAELVNESATTAEPDEDWITYREAADLRGSSETAISMLVKNNNLEKRKEPGFPIKISKAAIMAIRQNRKRAA